MTADVTCEKVQLRTSLLSQRRARSPRDRTAAAEAIALHATALPALARATRVAAYLSMPTEPGTGPLLQGLLDRHVSVLLPVSHPDRSLTWVEHAPDAVRAGPLGVPEPVGQDLGPDALAGCGIALVPALAVDHAGNRLGRGAGYYDRALARFDGVVCAVVFEDELLPRVPHEPHDRPVDLVLTPAGVFRPLRD
ncbi:5-formyltetrahydrofolate cyclo-ligase [Aeromicrobium duanguangcaii]|uniref:5-formyltetrahydrofolate cyclo-ligase n=1 Tax=Aeromicrobium duanguangcaii TaxID=2968086 RepID=A0ABY5KH61_9ACTN|nr:5-formyltetrahydrofolate cyclo-ligase [Aeromicrobium duanguangcaii]MCD9153825.1 5-formyltetrahydrofolate cyclo-ligase [Aeromicrobium duanguangcaii]UUI69093.1 5-formyltetrahydrofolate cyclo-ligase [Aeromicrobium duanguangcaii]